LVDLEDETTGDSKYFNLYRDADLAFLRDKGGMMRTNAIQGEMDDDCQTDEEQIEDAKEHLVEHLEQAVEHMEADRKDVGRPMIRNLDYGRWRNE